MTDSLQARALLVVSIVVAAFLGATGLVLDRAFRDSALAATRDRLQGHVYALLASAEPGPNGVLRVPETQLDPRFSQPGSGLYGEFAHGPRKLDWRSASAVGIDIPRTAVPPLGSIRVGQVRLSDGSSVFVASLSVLWQESKKKSVRYVFRVAESSASFTHQVDQFRRSLWHWLGGAAAVLLLLQALVMRWGFSPLRRVAADLAAIEAGQSARLSGRYPRELRALTDNLNALLDSASSHLGRYRDALGDLAHSLKTPLAVLRGSLQSDTPDLEALHLARQQIQNMNQIVEYQLKRAAASGRSQLATPIEVAPKVKQVVSALNKVYADKGVDCQVSIPAGLVFRGDEGDLLEILGNLSDNAYKWCKGRVMIKAIGLPAGRMELRVEDDGPGISADMAAKVQQRGERADSSVPGHGLGLAIVNTIAGTYGGRLLVERSTLGGAALIVRDLA